MVLYSQQAEDDLYDILWGLANWEKRPLGFEHAAQYVWEIKAEADTICTKFYHANAVYLTHKKYGSKVHSYRRNQNTQWFMLYNWDMTYRVAFVNKILNNYLTV